MFVKKNFSQIRVCFQIRHSLIKHAPCDFCCKNARPSNKGFLSVRVAPIPAVVIR